MATSKCPKCANTTFEMKINDVRDSKFKINFIQCASCGTVIGIQEYFNIGFLIHDLAKKLNIKLDS